MSKFSGKCDCYDYFCGKDNEYIKNSDIYIGRNPVPLRIESHYSLAPYYPFIVGLACFTHGNATVHLSEESYVDVSEAEHLGWILRDALSYYKKCKRNKVPYDEAEALKAVCWHEPYDAHKEIVHRVGMYGAKANVEGIHLPTHEHDRNKLLEEMMRLGWDENVARRWIWKDYWLIKQ